MDCFWDGGEEEGWEGGEEGQIGSALEVTQVTRGGGGTSEARPREVWIKAAVSYSCCIRATRKPWS